MSAHDPASVHDSRSQAEATVHERPNYRHQRRAVEREEPHVTVHARARWAERGASADVDLMEAWRRSITVNAPDRDCDVARLYAPSDVLFLLRDGAITTVCPANYDSIDTTSLGRCPECANLDQYRPGRSTCRWCGSDSGPVVMENGITVRFEGGE